MGDYRRKRVPGTFLVSSNLISIEGNTISGNTFAGVFFDDADRPFALALAA
jgi:parallel beta-helix repeat protein